MEIISSPLAFESAKHPLWLFLPTGTLAANEVENCNDD
jgi:hypothetical protein